jgi:hypothetical protein
MDWHLLRRVAVIGIVAIEPLVLSCQSAQTLPAATVAMEVVGGLVYMQGEVNRSQPLSVILDTGSFVSIVSPATAATLSLKSAQTGEAAGIGNGASETFHLVEDCELSWGEQAKPLKLLHQEAAILPIDYISAQAGKRVDALFGSNVFLNYTVTVDYAGHRLAFTHPGSGELPAGTSVSIAIYGNVPFVEAKVEGEDGKIIEALFLLDSGTSGAMILSRSFLDAHPGMMAATHFAATPSVEAVGGTIRSSRVRLPLLQLGPFQLSGVVAVVPDVSSGVLANEQIAGFIGAGVLKRFTVTWDYAGKRMFLAPNAGLTDEFDTDASGVHLTAAAPDYQLTSIDSVLPSSPAALAGLETGDQVVAVNGLSGLPLGKIAEALRRAGTTVALKVNRKGATVTASVALRSPFTLTQSLYMDEVIREMRPRLPGLLQ